ncbi:MAG: hypothetical protein K2Y32_14715 [Candidatus Obscuribacterales bacterium]|nr:hypothetical protein [Candidatus Obscuribacterales bacterium]
MRELSGKIKQGARYSHTGIKIIGVLALTLCIQLGSIDFAEAAQPKAKLASGEDAGELPGEAAAGEVVQPVKSTAKPETKADKSKSNPEKSEKSDKSSKASKPSKSNKSKNEDKNAAEQQSANSEESQAEGKTKARKEKKEKEPTAEELENQALEKEYQDNQAALAALLKKVTTPFTAKGEELGGQKKAGELSALTLNSGGPSSRFKLASLGDRLLVSRLYLPGRLVLGKPTQFTVKAKPGMWAAVAMADRDSGAKPIYGHVLRLGPDRKVVALGQVPDSGVLYLKYFAPVEGDLIGQSLFFEAAVWPDGHPEAVELAQVVSSEVTAKHNGILVTADLTKKKGVRIVPDSAIPPSQRNIGSGATLDSGKP